MFIEYEIMFIDITHAIIITDNRFSQTRKHQQDNQLIHTHWDVQGHKLIKI